MTRINDHLLAQDIDGQGVVLVDESSGEELFIPNEDLVKVSSALDYFIRMTVPPLRGAAPEDLPPGVGNWEQTVEGAAFIKGATEDALPKIKASAITIQLAPGDDPDAKIAVELGFTILLGKPIILVVPPGRPVPDKLRAVADVAVFDWDDSEDSKERLSTAISTVISDLGIAEEG